MSAEDIFDQAAADILETVGVTATYTPAVGDPVTGIYVNLLKNVNLEPEGFETQIWGPGITIEALLSDLGGEPNADETFKIDSTDYTVQTVLENDGRFVKMAVKE